MARLRKVLFILLVLTAALWRVTALADKSGTCGSHLTWTLNGDGLLTISGSGEMADYEASAPPWYSLRIFIKSVHIADGVTSIGESAFSSCHSLTSVHIPQGVTAIGKWAFYDCVSLTDVSLPQSLTSIGYFAFREL